MGIKGLVRTFSPPLTPETRVATACRTMLENALGAIAVSKEGRLVGMFTYRDLLERVVLPKLDPENTALGAVMSKDVKWIAADRSYGDALRLMVEEGYTYLPVVDDKGHLLGMLSLRELLEHEIDHLADELNSVTQYWSVDGSGGD